MKVKDTLYAATVILGTLIMLAGAYLAVKALQNLTFGFEPIAEQDRAWMSWLGSPTTTYWYEGHSFMMGMMVFVLGLGIAVAHQSVAPAIAGVLLAAVLAITGNPDWTVRAGLLDGTIRIGCYVPETAECREMLGLARDSAQSRYASKDDQAKGMIDAEWYTKRLTDVVPAEVHDKVVFYVLPGIAIARMLAHWGNADQLKAVIETQRQEAKDLRERLLEEGLQAGQTQGPEASQ
ncbi:hypothetical protein LMG26857_03675 [Achromobacter anxifer]|uniref:hypothetical protein n=1 Tax=Achromobacter anxifer TaxID=1287737 RepID=UPI00155BF2AD|nr:hypothetical protein [Achromobacter anxifer]CAB5514616.1 hypothetical protein LMG26857_03675 [Achromobacter anxifer]